MGIKFYSVTIIDYLGNPTCDSHFLCEQAANDRRAGVVATRDLRLSFVKVWTQFLKKCCFCEYEVKNEKS